MWQAIWVKTVRERRVAILVWGIGLGALIGLTLAYGAGLGAEARLAQAAIARTMPFRGDPVAVETPEGYATWHTVGLLPPLLAIWAVLAGAGIIRGEEERGILDLVLATPHARWRVLAEKLAGLGAAGLLIAALTGLGVVAGELFGGLAANAWGAFLAGVNISLAALVYGLLALVLAQFLARRAAVALAGALLAAGYLLDASSRTIAGAGWLGRLSPFYYHNLSKPLVPEAGVNAGALAGLALADLALAALALALFQRRDVGTTVLWARPQSPRARQRAGDQEALATAWRHWSVRGVWWRTLRAESAPILWWALVLGTSTVWIALLARTLSRSIADMIATTPALAALFRDFAMGTDTGFLGGVLLFYLPVLLTLQALTAALTWSGDLESGRQELVLAMPWPRWRILLERAAIVPLGAVALSLASWAAMLATARLAGMKIDAGRLTIAYLGLVPLALLTGAAAYALSGWLRSGGVVAVCGTLLAVSYFADVLNPLLELPGWALDLSIFHQYGRPLTDDPRWQAWLALAALAAGLMGLGVARFARVDIGHGT